MEGRPNVVDLVKGGEIQLLVNTPIGAKSFFDEKTIRRAAVQHRIPCITTIAGALAAVEGIAALRTQPVRGLALQGLPSMAGGGGMAAWGRQPVGVLALQDLHSMAVEK